MSEKIIYIKGGPQKGETLVFKRKSIGSILDFAGRFLAVSGLLTVLLLISPYLIIEAKWRLGLMGTPVVSREKRIVKESKLAKVIQVTDMNILKPEDLEFAVVIPKIGVNSLVVPNVPVEDKKQYEEALKVGLAHAAGSFFPDQEGSVYVFGHSTDYIWNVNRFNAIFYLLKELKPQDQVNLVYQNKRYAYEVTETKVVEADDPKLLNVPIGEEKLVLLTCWPPGTTWKRLVVIAKKV